jgi:hypothetical protein
LEDGRLVYIGEMAGVPVRTTLAPRGADGLEHLGELQVEGRWVAIDRETCTRVKK